MKTKINIPALLLALLVAISTNGILISEHICNTSKRIGFSFFTKGSCEMDQPVPTCCAKLKIKKNKDCCEDKEVFSKLSYEGIVAKKTSITSSINWSTLYYTSLHSTQYFNTYPAEYYSNLHPPGNLLTIKYLLKPSPQGLQNFRC
jgi:hypothetical protein